MTGGRSGPRRILVALGGNALMTDGDAGPAAQQAAAERAAAQVADLIAAGNEVAITHGNGPQVGNLLLKNDISRYAVPPVPLDWCVAQTQATIGYLVMTALERELAARQVGRAVAMLLTRVLVDSGDPAWEHPSKPIGQVNQRLVPSPEPREILDQDAVVRLLDDGAIVIAAGGGGIPMVREEGVTRGVEAVVDKDLCGALLASAIGADLLLIATDVRAVATGFGRGDQRWLTEATPGELRALSDAGEFGEGSMLPKVEACARFVDAGGERAAICHLDELGAAAAGTAGTAVRAGA